MNDFVDFARNLGLDITHAVPDGQLRRCKTFDKHSKLNGAYRFFGDWGWVQDWAAHERPVIWSNGKFGTEMKREQDLLRIAEQETVDRRAAMKHAREIVDRCKYGFHPYLVSKGFEQEQALIDTDGRLVVPMWTNCGHGALASVQWIDADGAKLFMTGGQAKGTAHILGPRQGVRWYVEGISTGWAVKKGLQALYTPGHVVVCFFAANLGYVAKQLGGGFVFADHDEPNPQTGKRAGHEAAIASGLPFVISPTAGQDANDLMQQKGHRAVAELMRGVM